MKAQPSLEDLRRSYQPEIPDFFHDLTSIDLKSGEAVLPEEFHQELKNLFPHTYGMADLHFQKGSSFHPTRPLKVGVVLSGGQAPGGHNVIVGIYEGLKKIHRDSELWGFLGGPQGILNGEVIRLEQTHIDKVRNQGGFDIIGSGRTKIQTEEQLETTCQRVTQMSLDGLVVIGGDDSNTNAALIAERFQNQNIKTTVIGVPKTIDGDLKGRGIEISFGHDTAARVYSELIGNISKDVLSAKKYYHFIRLMGRSASHVTLECALQTQPNLAWISEEVAARKLSLKDIAEEMAKLIIKRHAVGKEYGIILVPEGLIEFVEQMKLLIQELNQLLSQEEVSVKLTQLEPMEKAIYIGKRLSGRAAQEFHFLPKEIQQQLLMERDPHGNVQVSRIDTEKLLTSLTEQSLKEMGYLGKFNTLTHFFGYEGRSGYPTNFDASYCLSLGYATSLLIFHKKNGYMASITNLAQKAQNWNAGGIPLTSLLTLETRHGKQKPVIEKALVDLEGAPFRYFIEQRKQWALEDAYRYPGPIQFEGVTAFQRPITMIMEASSCHSCCC